MEYNVNKDKFSDGFSIDWFVWESVDTAHVYTDDVLKPMSQSHMDAKLTSTVFELSVPVARYGTAYRTIDCSKCENVGQLLSTIHAFYKTVIGDADIVDRIADVNAGMDDYLKDVRANLSKGVVVTWANLIGSSEYMKGDETTKDRRCSLSCSGLVRYEGIKGNMALELGS